MILSIIEFRENLRTKDRTLLWMEINFYLQSTVIIYYNLK